MRVPNGTKIERAVDRAADMFLREGIRHTPGIEELTDLLADLRHWSDTYACDFYEALDSSYARYLADKIAEGESQ